MKLNWIPGQVVKHHKQSDKANGPLVIASKPNIGTVFAIKTVRGSGKRLLRTSVTVQVLIVVIGTAAVVVVVAYF